MVKRLRNIKKIIILWTINHFFSGTHAFSIKRFMLNLIDGVSIGEGSKVVAPIYLYGSFTVGKDTWIGHDFYLEGNGHVSIGSNCDIAPWVACYTGSHEIGVHERRAGKGTTGNVFIGNGCWIGGSTKILLNSVIYDGVVVAAGSLVNGLIEGDCIIGGVPAKMIKKLV